MPTDSAIDLYRTTLLEAERTLEATPLVKHLRAQLAEKDMRIAMLSAKIDQQEKAMEICLREILNDTH